VPNKILTVLQTNDAHSVVVSLIVTLLWVYKSVSIILNHPVYCTKEEHDYFKTGKLNDNDRKDKENSSS